MKRTLEHFSEQELLGMKEQYEGIYLDGHLFITEELELQDNIFPYPSRLDVYFLIICLKGSFKVSLNLRDFTVHEGMAMLYTPECIVQLHKTGEAIIRTVAISDSFLQGIHTNPKEIFAPLISSKESPCWMLTEKEREIIDKYVSLIKLVYSLPEKSYKLEIIRGLISSVVFLFINVWKRESDIANDTAVPKSKTARHFGQFMNLLHEHHCREHYVGFYANEMNMTPKYLSTVIKEHSGKSAAEWIDEYLILEAKSLLKYSDKSIKEIVNVLHFSDASFFSKYFKKHTGLTPTAYKKIR
ncbi:MAG: helix-turn-helix domain-containing protein [Bacteroidales bacterium]|jgi:AraC family transcriptional activator of pobA|nr:helix-turn-helix domain-containing protein [Bacteroidales bacterium]MDY0174185.1 helix-turn-helix domain-containing protein [Bacteroidales bacterium]HHV40195.1 AraC family transcriptional regulator [Bacteroidales bacterium]